MKAIRINLVWVSTAAYAAGVPLCNRIPDGPDKRTFIEYVQGSSACSPAEIREAITNELKRQYHEKLLTLPRTSDDLNWSKRKQDLADMKLLAYLLVAKGHYKHVTESIRVDRRVVSSALGLRIPGVTKDMLEFADIVDVLRKAVVNSYDYRLLHQLHNEYQTILSLLPDDADDYLWHFKPELDQLLKKAFFLAHIFLDVGFTDVVTENRLIEDYFSNDAQAVTLTDTRPLEKDAQLSNFSSDVIAIINEKNKEHESHEQHEQTD